MNEIIQRDDWVLTLNEIKSRRLQLTIDLEMVEAALAHAQLMLDGYPAPTEDKPNPGPKDNDESTNGTPKA